MACRSPGRTRIGDGRPKQHGRQKRKKGIAGGREQEAMRFVLYRGLGSGKLIRKEKRIVFLTSVNCR
jgi:hypothetical protein